MTILGVLQIRIYILYLQSKRVLLGVLIFFLSSSAVSAVMMALALDFITGRSVFAPMYYFWLPENIPSKSDTNTPRPSLHPAEHQRVFLFLLDSYTQFWNTAVYFGRHSRYSSFQIKISRKRRIDISQWWTKIDREFSTRLHHLFLSVCFHKCFIRSLHTHKPVATFHDYRIGATYATTVLFWLVIRVSEKFTL